MPEMKGKLTVCDRCGREHFSKYIGQGDADGGYTTWDKYEELPESWLYESPIGYLCSDCACMFRTFIDIFMNGKHVAPAWQFRPEDYSRLDDIMIMLQIHKDMEASNA